jgi:hypothetical protein
VRSLAGTLGTRGPSNFILSPPLLEIIIEHQTAGGDLGCIDSSGVWLERGHHLDGGATYEHSDWPCGLCLGLFLLEVKTV